MSVVDEHDLWRAFDDAIAIANEWEGVPIEEKLARLGLDAAAVKTVLAERWDTYAADFDPSKPEEMFAQAMVEGLIAGMRLREEGS